MKLIIFHIKFNGCVFFGINSKKKQKNEILLVQ
jgi:hypothetical protein